MVDIARPDLARKKRVRRAAYAVAGVTALLLITVGVSQLKPAAPGVDRATVWIDTVKQGPMVRQVRGTGTLVPEDTRWIPATTEGRVEQILLRPGAEVGPDTVILELSNAELQQSMVEAELQLRAAEAQLTNRRVELESQLLNQQAAAATIEAEYRQARLQAEADAELAKDGLTSALTMKISTSRANELENRSRIEQQRVKMFAEAIKSQIAVQQAEVDRLRNMYQLRRDQVANLRVRAGMTGVLQTVPVEVGARVAPGTNLARVADPGRLKAELRIAETQARDIQVGLVASVDTRNGVVPGRVMRVDPAAVNGTVTVDVALEGELPRGARPDLTVDGTVELERLANVVYVGRPAFGQEQSTVGIFKVAADGTAERVQVKLGRSSVNTIEIVEGLSPGDQVVLSDMSAWDAFDRVRLN
ncbi:MAG: HlyD family efflux transporter periplasmic adaptor subunit [Vicinamibacteraceae bacterium]|nr:HlyD family efflux transporter periplasmic adaptor subunit [Vicinamibacteraceae bacterium]